MKHFLWKSSWNEEEFRRIIKSPPFFMALGLLRMARLGMDRDQNAFFFRDASACLNAIEPHLHCDF
jgi:hypothetical protein